MSVKLVEDLYLAKDKKTVVLSDDPQARFLLGRKGQELSNEDAKFYGIKSATEKDTKAADERTEKAKETAAKKKKADKAAVAEQQKKINEKVTKNQKALNKKKTSDKELKDGKDK